MGQTTKRQSWPARDTRNTHVRVHADFSVERGSRTTAGWQSLKFRASRESGGTVAGTLAG